MAEPPSAAEAEAEPSSRIIVSGFENFRGNNSQDPMDLLQWFCGSENKNGPKLEEFQPNQDNLFDWLLGGVGGIPDSPQASWKVIQASDNGPCHLQIQPPAKRDFWRKTYYDPVLIKDDAPFLYCTLPREQHCTVTAAFTLTAVSQFDQAGIMIRLSHSHWLKTGIEFVDGQALLSCVVTNSYSDWSTQPFADCPQQQSDKAAAVVVPECKIRVHCRGTNFVVQAVVNGVWRMIRIAHLSVHQHCRPDPLQQEEKATKNNNGPNPGHQELWAGVFAACPVGDQKGCCVTFTEFEIREGSDFDHSVE